MSAYLDLEEIRRHIRSELTEIEKRFHYSSETILACLCSFRDRRDIYEKLLKDFENEIRQSLEQDKELRSSVHSFRSRIKEYSSVADKMIKTCFKRNEAINKNANEKDREKHDKVPELITEENFFHPEHGVADLAGIRILHLKKGDWKRIHKFLTSGKLLVDRDSKKPRVELNWKRAYVKEKDKDQYGTIEGMTFFEEGEIEVKKTGYASLHYVFRDTVRYQIPGKDICLECQVRTVFDEGWGEISHEFDYPRTGHKIYQGHLAVLNETTAAANEVTAALEALQGLPVFIPWETEQQLERSAKEIHCLTPNLEWVTRHLDKSLENCDYGAADKIYYYVIRAHPEIDNRIGIVQAKLNEKGLDDRVKLFCLTELEVRYPVISDILWLHNAVDPKTSSECELAVVGGPLPPSGREEEQLDMLITDGNTIDRLMHFFKELEKQHNPEKT